jgi:hypothetical protein
MAVAGVPIVSLASGPHPFTFAEPHRAHLTRLG